MKNQKKRHTLCILMISFLAGLFSVGEPIHAEPTETPWEYFSWETVMADAVAFQQADGTVLPAIAINFSNMTADPDYVDVYRSSDQKKYSLLDSYCVNEEHINDYAAYYDTDISLNQTYHYYLVPRWETDTQHKAYTGLQSEKVSCKAVLSKPSLSLKNSGKKNVILLLPAYDFEEDDRMIPALDESVYLTGFQIFRSSKYKGGYKQIGTAVTSAETFTDKTAKKDKFYRYKIRAYYRDKKANKIVTGPFSESVMTQTGLPSFPTEEKLNFKVSFLSKDRAKLTWKSIRGFDVDRVEISSFKEKTRTFSAPKSIRLPKKKNLRSYILKGIKNNCAYQFSLVLSRNKNYHAGEIEITDSRNYKFLAVRGMADYVEGTSAATAHFYNAAADTAETEYTITCNPMYGISGYRFYTSVDDGKTYKLYRQTKGYKNTSIRLRTKHPTLQIKVSPYRGNKSCHGFFSIQNYLRSMNSKDIKIKKNSSGVATVSWKSMASSGAQEYRVYRYSYVGFHSGFPSENCETPYLVGVTASTSIQDTALTKKGTYTYVVVPVKTSPYLITADIHNGGNKVFTYK